MRTASALLSLGLLLGAGAPALAAATPEEAQRLTALFQSYLGSTPGVVSVTPQGDGYAAKLDLGPLFAKVKDPAVSLSLSPLEWTLTDQGGGKWKVDQDQPLSFSFGVKGQGETRGSIASVVSTGIFDEALGGLATSSAEMKTLTVEQTVTENGSTTKINYALDALSMQSSMAGTPDSADLSSTSTFTGLRETISMPASAGAAPATELLITSPSGAQQSTIKGFRLKPVGELITWLVAHQDPKVIVAEQAEFKTRMRAALPLFTSLSGTSTLVGVAASSPFGQMSLKQLAFGLDMNGITTDGRLRQTFKFSGLQLPQALVPGWAAGLVPDSFSLDLSVSDFDLATPAALILDRLDLSKPDPLPKDLDATLAQAVLPKGKVTVTLGPSEIMAKLFDLTAEGSMTVGPVAMPAGQALVKLKGLDDIMTALQAGPPDIQQISPALLLAKGLARTEADGALSWRIEGTEAGAITVNGSDVTKMLGGGQQ